MLGSLAKSAALDQVTEQLLSRVANKITQRDLATLERLHGCTGRALSRALIARAIRDSAIVGGVGGAVASGQWFAAPSLLAMPAEIISEAVITAVIEIRLVADLHTVHGVALPVDDRARAVVLLQSWAARRGVRLTSATNLPRSLSAAGRRSIQQRLLMRAVRNIGSFVPLLVGVAIGASVNRRETRALGEAIEQDLIRR